MAFLDGLTPALLGAALAVFAFGAWLISRVLPLRYALLLAAAKVLVPLAYFAANGAGLYHVSDDLAYYYEALRLLRQGYDPVSVLIDPWGLPQLLQLTGGHHVVYHLWNLGAMTLLGPYYHAPVFLNVAATFAAGYFFARLLEAAGFSKNYRLAALAFFLLHWDVLTWSSLLNLKDTLVLTLTLVLLYQGVRFFEKATFLRLAGIALLLAIFLFLRVYVAVLASAAFVLHFLLSREVRGRWKLLVLVAALAGGAVVWNVFGMAGNLGRVRLAELPYGLVRFLLTPLPWQISPGYGFLRVPATLHVLAVIPALLALPSVLKRGPAARLVFLYCLLVVVFYAVVPELQGPRQRLQIAFGFAWLQFHALWAFARYATASPGAGRHSQAQR